MAEEGAADEAEVKKKDKNENLTQALDDLELKVEHFRFRAQKLEQEREELLRELERLQCQSSSPTIDMSEGEREELIGNTERLIYRCLTVDITVHTVRTPAQEAALGKIKQLIADLDKMLKIEDGMDVKRKLLSYLNASLPEEIEGPTDQKFQGTLLQCTADDQKKYRRMLQARADQFLMHEDADSLSGLPKSNGCADKSDAT
ncbi:BAG family molecular chaperone regulator 2-like [Liolophura sinensis]|uniref:BAG family molecular chaperone regulator 2-like n=1 Tax=Liolophura sinensis TaxID=3198878 RepID=UPI0031582FAC